MRSKFTRFVLESGSVPGNRQFPRCLQFAQWTIGQDDAAARRDIPSTACSGETVERATVDDRSAQPGLRLAGVIPGKASVIAVQPHGADAVELTYKTAAGQLGQRVLGRDAEPLFLGGVNSEADCPIRGSHHDFAIVGASTWSESLMLCASTSLAIESS